MKIVVSMTTIPDRLYQKNGIATTEIAIQNLLSQSHKDYEIHLNIPKTYKDIEVKIPEWLTKLQSESNKLKVFMVQDRGPITKLLPTLQRISDLDTIIIIVDDDLYYMEDMISSHILAREKYPMCAIGFAGITAIDGSCHFCTTVKQDIRVKILEGYKSVSYKRSLFSDVDEFMNNFALKTWNDDISISAYLGYKNIQKIVLAYERDTDFSPRVESFPVVGHIPAESSGCFLFRNSQEQQSSNELIANEWYRLGYLER
jgi:hypothetical protein